MQRYKKMLNNYLIFKNCVYITGLVIYFYRITRYFNYSIKRYTSSLSKKLARSSLLLLLLDTWWLISVTCLFLLLFFTGLDLGYWAFLDHPIKQEIIFIAHSVEEIFEKFSQVTNIWFFLKFQASAIVHVNSKFLRITLA